MAPPVSAAAIRLTVEVRQAYTLPPATTPRINENIAELAIQGALIEVQGNTFVTNRNGDATVTITPGLQIELKVSPAADQVSPGPAAPGHGSGGFNSAPRYMFREFKVVVDVNADGFVLAPAPVVRPILTGTAPRHANLLTVSKSKLRLDWKADWIKSSKRTAKTQDNDLLVIHHTDKSEGAGHINTFLTQAAIHYMVDLDGHVIKFAHESDEVRHTGASSWQNDRPLNARAIGIEIVHTHTAPEHAYTAEQMIAVQRLVQLIRAAHPKITRHRVVGHSDIRGTSTTDFELTVRADCPSEQFDWPRLENANLVRKRVVSPGPPPNDFYGIGPNQFAQRGSTQPSGLAVNIAQLQRDVHAIGYSLGRTPNVVSGVFDSQFRSAIERFQLRYFSRLSSAPRGRDFAPGRVNFETAKAIFEVASDTLP